MQTIYKPKGKYWDKAWSLIEGCTPVSAACDNCWLASMEYRFHNDCHRACPDCPKSENYTCDKLSRKNPSTGNIEFKGIVKAHPERLVIPLNTRKPTTFAIWSDLFHEQVPDYFIKNAFEIMEFCKQHTFLVCTKRPKRMAEYIQKYEHKLIPNIYLGTTAENQEMANERIPELLKCKPFKLFLSVEPMLSFIQIPKEQLQQISYVVAGSESGHNKRETKEEWFRDLREQCIEAGVPFFLKQPSELQHLSTIKREDLWK